MTVYIYINLPIYTYILHYKHIIRRQRRCRVEQKTRFIG